MSKYLVIKKNLLFGDSEEIKEQLNNPRLFFYEVGRISKLYGKGIDNDGFLMVETPEIVKLMKKEKNEEVADFYRMKKTISDFILDMGIAEIVEIARIIKKEQRYKILTRQSWKCNSCSCSLKYSSKSNWDAEVAHIDHIFPYSKKEGYPNGICNINEDENLQALCSNCNLKKGTILK